MNKEQGLKKQMQELYELSSILDDIACQDFNNLRAKFKDRIILELDMDIDFIKESKVEDISKWIFQKAEKLEYQYDGYVQGKIEGEIEAENKNKNHFKGSAKVTKAISNAIREASEIERNRILVFVRRWVDDIGKTTLITAETFYEILEDRFS